MGPRCPQMRHKARGTSPGLQLGLLCCSCLPPTFITHCSDYAQTGGLQVPDLIVLGEGGAPHGQLKLKTLGGAGKLSINWQLQWRLRIEARGTLKASEENSGNNTEDCGDPGVRLNAE